MTESREAVSGVTSCSMLSRARGQDAQAWQRLVQLYSPLVFHWCRQSGFTSHDAADLMQEAFQAIFKSLDRFEREKPGAFRAWLWTITRNKIRDHVRHRVPQAIGGSSANQHWQDIPDSEPEPDDQSISGEGRHSLLHRALDLVRGDFNDTTWRAFQAVVIDQRPAREVAADLGVSIGAVYQARARVLHRLHEELGDVVEFQ